MNNVIDFIPYLVTRKIKDRLEQMRGEIIVKFQDVDPKDPNYTSKIAFIKSTTLNEFIAFREELMVKYNIKADHAAIMLTDQMKDK